MGKLCPVEFHEDPAVFSPFSLGIFAFVPFLSERPRIFGRRANIGRGETGVNLFVRCIVLCNSEIVYSAPLRTKPRGSRFVVAGRNV